MRNRRYDSMHSLTENAYHSIHKGDLHSALKLIHDFVERIITEPICTAQIFGSKTLDDLCHSRESQLVKN